jgi:hypothetical protein
VVIDLFLEVAAMRAAETPHLNADDCAPATIQNLPFL